MNAQEQYNIILVAIEFGDLDEAWELVAQFEEFFILSHRALCNELANKVAAIDPIFNGAK